jgi:hypothetical protein
VALSDKLIVLIRSFWSPARLPPVNHDLEDRLDAVDKRLDRLIVAQYRAAERELKHKHR